MIDQILFSGLTLIGIGKLTNYALLKFAFKGDR